MSYLYSLSLTPSGRAADRRTLGRKPRVNDVNSVSPTGSGQTLPGARALAAQGAQRLTPEHEGMRWTGAAEGLPAVGGDTGPSPLDLCSVAHNILKMAALVIMGYSGQVLGKSLSGQQALLWLGFRHSLLPAAWNEAAQPRRQGCGSGRGDVPRRAFCFGALTES